MPNGMEQSNTFVKNFADTIRTNLVLENKDPAVPDVPDIIKPKQESFLSILKEKGSAVKANQNKLFSLTKKLISC